MSKRRTERLLSIVVLLLSSRRYLTAEQIRAAVSGYPEAGGVVQADVRAGQGGAEGPWHPPGDRPGRTPSTTTSATGSPARTTSCPEINLEPDEVAVLGLASRVWQSAEFAGAAAGALLKLKAASSGIDDDDHVPGQHRGIEPRLTTQEPAFGPLWEAVRDRLRVTFEYQANGRSDATRKRTLEPWGVVNRRGRWYVAGHDSGRNAPRVFRMSRITGPVRLAGPPGSVHVPDGTDVPASWSRTGTARPRQGPHRRTPRCAKNAGVGLTRWAREVVRDQGTSGLGQAHGQLRRFRLVRGLPRVVRSRRDRARPARPARIGDQRAQGGARVTTPRATGGRACGSAPAPRMVTSAERRPCLLALVPYVVARRAVGLAETAAAFGMTERELIDDLNLVWCVELKAPEPYCPIDLSYEDGEITISQAESIARPPPPRRPTRPAPCSWRCACWPRPWRWRFCRRAGSSPRSRVRRAGPRRPAPR